MSDNSPHEAGLRRGWHAMATAARNYRRARQFVDAQHALWGDELQPAVIHIVRDYFTAPSDHTRYQERSSSLRINHLRTQTASLWSGGARNSRSDHQQVHPRGHDEANQPRDVNVLQRLRERSRIHRRDHKWHL